MRSVIQVVGAAALSLGLASAQNSKQMSVQEYRRTHHFTAADALAESGPDRPNALAEVQREEAQRREAEKAAEQAAQKAASDPKAPSDKADKSDKKDTADASAALGQPAAPVVPTVQPAPPGPPQKDLTGDEFGSIHEGSTAKEVLALLGPPSSRVVVPEDDGRLRETFQYWVKGVPTATIRLDNGKVVQIVTKPK